MIGKVKKDWKKIGLSSAFGIATGIGVTFLGFNVESINSHQALVVGGVAGTALTMAYKKLTPDETFFQLSFWLTTVTTIATLMSNGYLEQSASERHPCENHIFSLNKDQKSATLEISKNCDLNVKTSRILRY